MTNKTLLTAAIATAITAGALSTTADTASAGALNDRAMTSIWVSIDSYPDEGLWEACRRVYQRDVFQVRHGHHGQVRCKIDHSRVYDYNQRFQNFN